MHSIILMCLRVSLCEFMYTTYMKEPTKAKRVLDPLGLESQAIVSKRTGYSYSLSILSKLSLSV